MPVRVTTHYGIAKQFPISTNIIVGEDGVVRNLNLSGRILKGKEYGGTIHYFIKRHWYSIEELFYMAFKDVILDKKDTVRRIDPQKGLSLDNLESVYWRTHRRGVLARQRDRIRVTPVTWSNNQWVAYADPEICIVKDVEEKYGIKPVQVWYRCKKKDGTLVPYVFTNSATPFDGYRCELIDEVSEDVS